MIRDLPCAQARHIRPSDSDPFDPAVLGEEQGRTFLNWIATPLPISLCFSRQCVFRQNYHSFPYLLALGPSAEISQDGETPDRKSFELLFSRAAVRHHSTIYAQTPQDVPQQQALFALSQPVAVQRENSEHGRNLHPHTVNSRDISPNFIVWSATHTSPQMFKTANKGDQTTKPRQQVHAPSVRLVPLMCPLASRGAQNRFQCHIVYFARAARFTVGYIEHLRKVTQASFPEKDLQPII